MTRKRFFSLAGALLTAQFAFAKITVPAETTIARFATVDARFFASASDISNAFARLNAATRNACVSTERLAEAIRQCMHNEIINQTRRGGYLGHQLSSTHL